MDKCKLDMDQLEGDVWLEGDRWEVTYIIQDVFQSM